MPELNSLTIGQVAKRTGLAISTIRFYESQRLVQPTRNSAGHRRFRSSDIRRLSFVMITQQLGFTLEEIRARLQALPDGRTPTRADWARISRAFRDELSRRIEIMSRMRERLDGCIGCGCLSLKKCSLYNPQDQVARSGPGPRFLLEDKPDGSTSSS